MFGEGLVEEECGEIWLRQIATLGYVIRKEKRNTEDWEVLRLIVRIVILMLGWLRVFCVPGFQERESGEVLFLHPHPCPGHSGARAEDLGLCACCSELGGVFCGEDAEVRDQEHGLGSVRDRAGTAGAKE